VLAFARRPWLLPAAWLLAREVSSRGLAVFSMVSQRELEA
jgi:hypothetical protein